MVVLGGGAVSYGRGTPVQNSHGQILALAFTSKSLDLLKWTLRSAVECARGPSSVTPNISSEVDKLTPGLTYAEIFGWQAHVHRQQAVHPSRCPPQGALRRRRRRTHGRLGRPDSTVAPVAPSRLLPPPPFRPPLGQVHLPKSIHVRQIDRPTTYQKDLQRKSTPHLNLRSAPPLHCRADSAHIRQSTPDSGLDLSHF